MSNTTDKPNPHERLDPTFRASLRKQLEEADAQDGPVAFEVAKMLRILLGDAAADATKH
jgi:hypothetical protein